MVRRRTDTGFRSERDRGSAGAVYEVFATLPALRDAIETAYGVFGRYHIGSRLYVCRCNVCMSEASEREIVTTPLRELRSLALAEYTNSAHDWREGMADEEMRHFLPRYFELIAQHDPQNEAAAVEAFFDALVLDTLQYCRPKWEFYGWRLSFDLSKILMLIVTAGGDLERALAVWDAAPDPQAVAHMAAMRRKTLAQAGEARLDSPFLEEFHSEAAKIGAFVMRPELACRIERAFFVATDPVMQQMLSDALG